MSVLTRIKLSSSSLIRARPLTWYLTLQAVQTQPRCACMQGDVRKTPVHHECIMYCPPMQYTPQAMYKDLHTLYICRHRLETYTIMISYVAHSGPAGWQNLPAMLQVRGKTVYPAYSTRQEIVHSKQPLDGPSNVLLVTTDNLDVSFVSACCPFAV